MTKREVIKIITDQYAEMPDDVEIDGIFLVTRTKSGRVLLAHGELDLSQLYKALSDFNENTTG